MTVGDLDSIPPLEAKVNSWKEAEKVLQEWRDKYQSHPHPLGISGARPTRPVTFERARVLAGNLIDAGRTNPNRVYVDGYGSVVMMCRRADAPEEVWTVEDDGRIQYALGLYDGLLIGYLGWGCGGWW